MTTEFLQDNILSRVREKRVSNVLSVYRFVLFKRHYDKYVALAAKYEEAKGIAYYLEERYHEVKVRGKRSARLLILAPVSVSSITRRVKVSNMLSTERSVIR